MLSWIRRVTRSFEESSAPLPYFFACFLFWVALRTLIESRVFHDRIEPKDWAHFVSGYLSLVLWLALVLGIASRHSPVKLLRALMAGFVFVLLAPVLDYLLYRPVDYQMGYLLVDSLGELGRRYLSYFGPREPFGITPGIRIEVAAVLALCAVYLFVLTRSWLRSALGTLGAYTAIFVHCSMRSWLVVCASGLGLPLLQGDDAVLQVRAFVAASLAAGLGVAWLSAPGTLRTMLRDLRGPRILHYCLLFALGLACVRGATITVDRLLQVGLGFASVILSCLFALMINNVFDVEIDRINAPDRPLVTGAIDAVRYERAAFGVLAVTLAVAASASFSTLCFAALFSLAYFVYSAPPLRLKTRCAVSKAVIGINSAAAFVAGWSLFGADFLEAPARPLLVLLLGYSLGAHVIDLKDVEGDRAAGIRNLSTMLGLRRAQWVIGTLAGITYLAFAWYFRSSWFGWALALAAVLQFFGIVRKDYRDRFVVLVQDAVLALAVLYVRQRG
jgi:4-hydroxybenzoate polyprenyltransferase